MVLWSPGVLGPKGPEGAGGFQSDGSWVWSDRTGELVAAGQYMPPEDFVEQVLDCPEGPKALSPEEIREARD